MLLLFWKIHTEVFGTNEHHVYTVYILRPYILYYTHIQGPKRRAKEKRKTK